MSDLAYHLKEMDIQRRPDDPRNVRPLVPDDVRRILDVGGGIGQTLATTDLPPHVFACAVDIDEEAVTFGAKTIGGIHFARASGEHLPFADESFDMVISRVSLPWMHMPSALREICRVLSPGGRVWFMLADVSWTLSQLAAAAKHRNVKNVVYRLYVLVNGVLFHFTRRQIRYPLQRARCESFQTTRGMTNFLRSMGLEETLVQRGKLFVVTATKPRGRAPASPSA